MTDHSLTALARDARRLLADARNATLLVEGIGRLADAEAILLHDMDGRPRFYCPTGSSLMTAAAAGRSAVLGVAAESPTQVVFAGQLAVIGTERVGPERVDIVELRLSSVIVEQDDVGSPIVVTHQVPLAQYYQSGADPVVAAAERIRHHTNAHHADRLRAFVAARTQVWVGAIADARITALDAAGANIAWIDFDGAHEARFRFTGTAADPAELAALLRGQLNRPVGSITEDRR